MPVICRKCGKSTSEKLAACYACGELLNPPIKCGGCGKENVSTRTACQYCGERLGVAAAAAQQEADAELVSAPPKPARPVAMGDARPMSRTRGMPAPPMVSAPPQPTAGEARRPGGLDLALLILATPVWLVGLLAFIAWGVLVFLLSLLGKRRTVARGASMVASFIQNPSALHFMVFSLASLMIAFFMTTLSDDASPWWQRNALWLMIGSAVCGLLFSFRRYQRDSARRTFN
jgi:hypothetical protein